jgi:hypothetical protein
MSVVPGLIGPGPSGILSLCVVGWRRLRNQQISSHEKKLKNLREIDAPESRLISCFGPNPYLMVEVAAISIRGHTVLGLPYRALRSCPRSHTPSEELGERVRKRYNPGIALCRRS